MQPSYPSMQSPNHRPGKLDTLSHHAIIQTSYPSMQLPNHRPGKLDMLSQHAVETNHRSGNQTCYPSMHSADKLFQHALQNMHCIKEAAKSKTADKLTQQNSCRTRGDLHKKSKQLQHLRRLGKRHEA